MGYGNVGNPTTLSTWALVATSWDTITGPWTMSYDLQDKVLLFADPGNTKLYRDRSGNQEDTTDMVSFIERTGITLNAMTTSSDNTINVYLGTQMSTDGGITWKAPVTFDPNEQSKVSVRGTGKLYAIRFESTTNMTWELDGYAIEVSNVGARGSRMST